MIPETNFAKLLDDLHAKGWSLYRIAKHVGECRIETVRNWRNLEPRYTRAILLIELHRTVTTSSATFHMEHK